MRFYFDEHGFRRADVFFLPTAVGYFLGSDIQGSVRCCEELLELIDQVATRTISRSEGTGNAFTLILTPEDAEIECLWSEENKDSRKVRILQFREALSGWRDFVVADSDSRHST